MKSRPQRQRLTAWLTIACILGMLSSGLAHALAGASAGAPWQEICSLGSATQALDDLPRGDRKQGGAEPGHLTHCPFCSKFDHAPALLSRIDPVIGPHIQAPAPARIIWLPAATLLQSYGQRPRGPPSMSAAA